MKGENLKMISDRRGCFLGKDNEGNSYYLEKASWDCDWYWGFGYVEIYTKRGVHDCHTHFDSLFLKNNIFDSFKELITDTTLKDNEIWELLGYMKEFYIARDYAELLKYGNHITGRARNITLDCNKVENEAEYNRINKIILPQLFEKIYKLFEEV